MHIHIDAVGGIAGDMFLSALIAARPDMAEGACAAIRAAGIPGSLTPEFVAHTHHGLAGIRFGLTGDAPKEAPPHDFADFRAMIEGADLTDGVKAHAVGIMRRIAEAEGKVHGRDPDHVHFHEIADWDTLADSVGAGFIIDSLDGATWSVSPLPLGGGRVKTAHGILPVPAPATAELLRGFAMVDDGVTGERVTPTGAAILRHLDPAPRAVGATGPLAAQGFGFGTKELPGIPNMVRVLMFDEAAERGDIAVLSFEIDDQTAEDLAVGLDSLRARDDILDVIQSPVFGKKGRIAASVRVLCRIPAAEAVIAACFTETTTLGVRWHTAWRAELPRQATTAGGARVKVATRPGDVRTAKAEMDDLRDVPGGHAGRDRARIAAEHEKQHSHSHGHSHDHAHDHTHHHHDH